MAAEEAAREAETRFRAVFDNVPVAMVLMGRDLRILDANPAASALTGLPREELASGSLADVTHPDDVGRAAGRTAELFAGEVREFSVEQRIATRGGRYAAMSVTTTAVGDAGRPACAMATLQALRAAENARRAGSDHRCVLSVPAVPRTASAPDLLGPGPPR
jgi:PAS domain S-box-containing protein